MLRSLLRPSKQRETAQRWPASSPNTPSELPWPCFSGKTVGGSGTAFEEPYYYRGGDHRIHDDTNEEEDEDDNGEDDDGPIECAPLLPIFSAPHLDILPVYDITHAIRSLIVARCETTLTWDQLRSPQISQFLVKPIQQKIISKHFSRATLYALLTNCLQFNREVHLNPGNSGTNHTRAMMSELLAIKLLREYTTRELIDALSYEFYPLQGQTSTAAESGWSSTAGAKRMRGVARISCLEIAIRAQSKRFLSHPLVVKQLEAIWAGTIVFHSAADSLHRSHTQLRQGGGGRTYGTTPDTNPRDNKTWSDVSSFRRSVTLYDPRDASLFKLSRLRVPRYRQFLSTLSFAVLLGLFLAVLQQRSTEITPLEIIFWLWSAGFMLDEIVGFNEQGFSLYLMSFWNIFDLGILFLLFCYYCMRLYGALLPHSLRQAVAEKSYDVLAANAVLLFPRLFSILDHYRYFSQLLIAFRIMASDLVAVFLLVIIACSGFFVAFTLSFGNSQENSAGSVAYALFQMLMGFTPAAWTLWDEYNTLGKVILTMFLFICHFVVVTILITVLTNSFMSIVQNANQEHQFLFAVNTISMVKSDALFSYVAPTNILAWLLTPLRYLMPFKQFVRVNRTIIKITHMPILFTICLYEKTILGSRVIESADLIDSPIRSEIGVNNRGARSRLRALSSQAPRFVREPSVATYQKDRALEEVFRNPFHEERIRSPARNILQHKSNKIVNHWMQALGTSSVNSPDEQDYDEVDRLERRLKGRMTLRDRRTRSLRNFTESINSASSTPLEHAPHVVSSPTTPRHGRSTSMRRSSSQHTAIEGDNELTSDDNGGWEDEQQSNFRSIDDDFAQIVPQSPGKSTPKFYSSRPSTATRLKSRRSSPVRRPKYHSRHPSGGTILYNPILSPSNDDETDGDIPPARLTGSRTPGRESRFASSSRWTPRSHSVEGGRSRNPVSQRTNSMSMPDGGNFIVPGSWHHTNHNPSTLGLGSDLGDNKAITNGFIGGVPSSFTTQMAYATGRNRRGSPQGNQDMLSKLVLARMNNIEEGFREVIKEVKDLRREGSSQSHSRVDEQRGGLREKRKAEKKESKRKTPGSRKSKASSEGALADD